MWAGGLHNQEAGGRCEQRAGGGEAAEARKGWWWQLGLTLNKNKNNLELPEKGWTCPGSCLYQ